MSKAKGTKKGGKANEKKAEKPISPQAEQEDAKAQTEESKPSFWDKVCKFFKRDNKASPETDANVGDGDNPSNDALEDPNKVDVTQPATPDADEQQGEAVVSKLLKWTDSTDLAVALDRVERAVNIQDEWFRIKSEKGIDESVGLYEYIKSLDTKEAPTDSDDGSQRASNPESASTDESGDEKVVVEKAVELIKEECPKDDRLSEVLRQANESKTCGVEYIRAFFSLIADAFKEGVNTSDNNQGLTGIEITESQLRNSSNRHVLKKWVVSQIRDHGFDGGLQEDLSKIFTKVAKALTAQKAQELGAAIETTNQEGTADAPTTKEDFNGLFIGELKKIFKDCQLSESSTVLDIVNWINQKIDDARQMAEELTQSSATPEEEPSSESSEEDAEDATARSVYVAVKPLFEEYKVDTINKLLDAFVEGQFNKVKDKRKKELKDLLGDKAFGKFAELIDALIGSCKTLKGDITSRDEIINDAITNLSKKIKVDNDKKHELIQLLEAYIQDVDAGKERSSDEIKRLEGEVSRLTGENRNKDSQIQKLATDRDNKQAVLDAETDGLIDALHKGIDYVRQSYNEETEVLVNCSPESQHQRAHLEEELRTKLDKWLNQLKEKEFNSSGSSPVDVRERIQNALKTGIENGPISKVCLYYAYSKLPFMTDVSSSSRVAFDRKNMFQLYNAVENLYVRFGIHFDLPPLFAIDYDKDEFDQRDGALELDNLCPSARSHRSKIDSENIPTPVIVDIAEVGYSVDGKQVKKTGVITF